MRLEGLEREGSRGGVGVQGGGGEGKERRGDGGG